MPHKPLEGSFRFAVVTISDTRYRMLEETGDPSKVDDPSGKLIIELMKGEGHELVHYAIVPDDVKRIRNEVLRAIYDRSADVVITTGGTGIARKDVTYEAIAPLLLKELPGFGEIFRFLSFQEIGTSALLSRSFAGIIEESIVFCLPGSEDAVRLAVRELIIPSLGHILRHLRE